MGRYHAAGNRRRIERCLRAVQFELADLGLLTPALVSIPLRTPWTDLSMDFAYASYFYAHSWWMPAFRVRKGDLVVPLLSIARWADQARGAHVALQHTLRHELGHALAYTSPRWLIRANPAFAKAFGFGHDADRTVVWKPGEVVSSFAKQGPAEDFAETFAWFVRARGRLPAPESVDPRLYAKMRFIAGLRGWMKRGLPQATRSAQEPKRLPPRAESR